jgi:hypothetical protein
LRHGSFIALILVLSTHSSAAPITLRDKSQPAGLGSIFGISGSWYGSAVAFVDLDGDGWADLYFGMASGQADQLCRNQRDGTFSCGRVPGVAVNAGDVLAIASGDYDGDGDLDLYVMRNGPNSLLRNDGHFHFTDVGAATGTAGDTLHHLTTTGTFLDFDRDGRLDLYLGHWAPMGHKGPDTANQLLQQGADGKFRDVSPLLGSNNRDRPTLALLAVDYDGDGLQDLYVTGDFNLSELLHNDGGSFSDVTALQPMGFDSAVTEGMGIDAADVDGDGWLDLYATGNKQSAGTGLAFGETGSALLLGGGAGFHSVAIDLGVNANYSWGTGFVDLDDDGWPDIFVATNMDDHYSIYRSQAGQAFTLEAFPGFESGHNNCVTAAFADYDNDGRVDIVLHELDGHPPRLLHNETQAGHWLGVLLSGDGDRLGARISLTAGGRTMTRELLSQTSHGSDSDRRFTFGLGDATRANVVVTFPDGKRVEADNLAADRIVAFDREGLTDAHVAPPSGCSFAASPQRREPSPLFLLIGLLWLLWLLWGSRKLRSWWFTIREVGARWRM